MVQSAPAEKVDYCRIPANGGGGVQMMMSTTQDLRKAMLTAITATGASLNGALLALIKEAWTPSPDTKWADLVEADFSGYARPAALVYGAPFQNSDGNWEIAAPSVQFVLSATTVVNTVYGWVVVRPTTNLLLVQATLDQPVPLSEVGDGLVVLPSLVYAL